jgi:hypothetical protein
MMYIKPSSNLGWASTAAVRASTATVLLPTSEVGVSPSVTYQKRSSSISCEANMGTLPGCSACATCITLSRLARGAAFGQVGRLDFRAQQVADLMVKNQRQPVRHSSSMKTVQTRLLHLWTQVQALILAAVHRGSPSGA